MKGRVLALSTVNHSPHIKKDYAFMKMASSVLWYPHSGISAKCCIKGGYTARYSLFLDHPLHPIQLFSLCFLFLSSCLFTGCSLSVPFCVKETGLLFTYCWLHFFFFSSDICYCHSFYSKSGKANEVRQMYSFECFTESLIYFQCKLLYLANIITLFTPNLCFRPA